MCSRPDCPRNGRRQRDVRWMLEQNERDVEPPPPVSPSPRQEDAAPDVVEPPAPSPAELTFEQELAELRGLLHELLEVSTRICRRFGLTALYREVDTLERVVRVWGGRYVRWGR